MLVDPVPRAAAHRADVQSIGKSVVPAYEA